MKQFPLIILLLLLLCGTEAGGQNQPVFRQWYTVPGIYNPALTGDKKGSSLSLLHRRQWVTSGNGPVASGLLFEHAGHRRLNFGLAVTSQEIVRLISSDSRMMLAYLLPLTSRATLRFGMSLGFVTRRLNTGSDDFSNDPAVLRAADGVFGASGSFGLALEKGPFQIAAALPSLVPQENFSPAQLSSLGNSQFLSQWYSIRYRGKGRSGNLETEVWSVYRVIRDLRRNWEAGASFTIYRAISLGANYNSALGAGMIIGFQLPAGIQAGYCWEPGFGAQNSFGVSHEFRLSIRMGGLTPADRLSQKFPSGSPSLL